MSYDVSIRLDDLVWVKSSYSTPDGPDCVEVAASVASVHVRDSKRKTGPQLALPSASWRAFVEYVGR
ncbi:DUF397 domain-containing protein [Streptomyces sp. OF3]|uniref:DUF397 domain-containing protein n=1 Tax=Streptomyces alkaliterrae TaxID=2213162 RepID=A0A7W3WR69_9ACTN|nr:DUF397 domain-containing protein [Streptomyces alkaliterrae]MBB1256775.1 DUF397 domain-containing protein [Streptomyces alkaliterrae]